MPNIRDNLHLYVLTASAAIVCVAALAQAVNPESPSVAGTQASHQSSTRAHLAKLHDWQLQDVL